MKSIDDLEMDSLTKAMLTARKRAQTGNPKYELELELDGLHLAMYKTRMESRKNAPPIRPAKYLDQLRLSTVWGSNSEYEADRKIFDY